MVKLVFGVKYSIISFTNSESTLINQVSLDVKSIKTLQDMYLNLEPQVIMGLEIEERIQGCSLLYNKRLHKYYKNYISWLHTEQEKGKAFYLKVNTRYWNYLATCKYYPYQNNFQHHLSTIIYR